MLQARCSAIAEIKCKSSRPRLEITQKFYVLYGKLTQNSASHTQNGSFLRQELSAI